MKIRILSCAEQELVDAVDFYNQQRPGLGYEFAVEVRNAMSRIVAFPNAWPAFSARTRRCIINRFPYGILYQLRTDHILITAIMHLKSNPKKWQERITKT